MSSLHYFANRYRNRVSRKREFFNLYKTVFVILNMQKSHKISLFKILQLFYHVASQTSSIFTCNTCTKSRGLFSGYFSAAYAFRTLILLSLFCFSLFCPEMPCFARVSGVRVVCSEITDCGKSEQN